MLYYRLRQVDYDGSATYSKTVALWNRNIEPLDIVSLFPQPAKGAVTIVFNKVPANLSLKLYDTNGKIVWTDLHTPTDNHFQLVFDQLRLSRGIYLLHVEESDGMSVVRKLLVD
jgi:hypothetical protein